jgi:2'-5' RNA ligase
VTLKFIGEAREAELGKIVAALDAVCARNAAFHVTLGKFGAFPSMSAPRVLFFDVAIGDQPLAALAEDVDRSLEEAIGLDREARDFHAHVTVARIKDPLPRVGRPTRLGSTVVTPCLSRCRLRPHGKSFGAYRRPVFGGQKVCLALGGVLAFGHTWVMRML